MALVDGQCQRFSDTLRSRRHHPTSLERGHHASHASSRHIIRRMRRLVCGSGRQIIGADRYNRSPISYWGRPDLPLLRAAVALRGVGKRTLHRCADDGTSSRQAPRGLCRQSQCGREGSFQVAAMPLPAMLAKLDELPEAIRTTCTQQWRRPCKPLDVLAGYGGRGGEPTEDLARVIARDFGSVPFRSSNRTSIRWQQEFSVLAGPWCSSTARASFLLSPDQTRIYR